MLMSLVLAGCGGGGGVAESADRVCPLMKRLHDSGKIMAEADLADPDHFLAARDDAVAEYVTTLDRLVEVAPDDLRDDVTTTRSAVEQFRFDDAVASQAPIDEYADRHCSESSGDQPAKSR